MFKSFRWQHVLSLTAFWFVLAALAVLLPGQVQALPADAPPQVFSAQRAFVHVQAIAQAPHPAGSAANARVRDYLLAELEKLGLPGEVQSTLSVRPEAGSLAQVENVLARLPGARGAGKALVLVAHYDSTPTGPGAADNAAAVAALLETARALQAGPPLQNDVIFLFSDAEELHLFGAAAFIEQHPWAADVGMALNFEARGNSGPVFMFETGADNGAIIADFARTAAHPVANSLMYEVYRNMPNDTDFSEFKHAGLPGLNFAFLRGAVTYHSLLDNPANLDQRSLQQHGDYALSLAHSFGNQTLPPPAQPNRVYFDLFGQALVHYPGVWALPLGGLGLLLTGLLIFLAVRRSAVKASGVAWGALAALLNVLLAAGAGWLGWELVKRLFPAYTAYGPTYNGDIYWAAFLALAFALVLGQTALWRPKLKTLELGLGLLAWWALLALGLSIALPGASYPLTWALLFGLAGVGALLWLGERMDAGIKTTVLALAFSPAVILFAPLVYTFHAALTIMMIFIPAALAALVFSALAPFLTAAQRWLLPGLALALAAGLFIWGGLTSRFSPEHPQPVRIAYGLDADHARAYWIGFEAPDAWTAQFLGAAEYQPLPRFWPYASGEIPTAAAPVVELPGPEARVLDDRVVDGVRRLRLQMRSPRGGLWFVAYTVSGGEVLAITIEGRRMTETPAFDYWAPPVEGFEVEYELLPGEPFELLLVDRSYGLPELPPTSAFAYPPKGPALTDYPSLVTNATLVSRSYTFGP